MRSATAAFVGMPDWLRGLLVLLAVWYDPEADKARLANADRVTRKTWQSSHRAHSAIEAYRAEQAALRHR